MFRSINKNYFIALLLLALFVISSLLILLAPVAQAGPYYNVNRSGWTYYASNMTQAELDDLLRNGGNDRPNIIQGVGSSGNRTSFIYLGTKGDYNMYRQQTSAIDNGVDCRAYLTVKRGIPASGGVDGGSAIIAPPDTFDSTDCNPPKDDYTGVEGYNFLNINLQGNDTAGYPTGPADPGGDGSGADEDGETGDDGNDCADAGFVLGWIICPIGSAFAEITKVIDSQLYSLLFVDTSSWDDSGVRDAWSNLRVLASTLIVLVVLIGVASQVFNFDFVSAYTIRKILPKLFIAVILIQLSYFLTTAAINLSNTVGFSTQALISAPFTSIADQYNEGQSIGEADENPIDSGDGWIGFADVLTVFAKNSGSANLEGAAVAAGGVIGGLFAAGTLSALAFGSGAAGIGGVMIYLLALLIPAVLALLAAFLVIILRVVLLIAFVVVAPLAFVAWILPNTSKWFDRWGSLFFSLLAFFPIVIAFLTFGKIGSLIIATSAGAAGLRNIVILTGVIIAYFLPYFLLFKLIRFSAGALGKIQGAVDSISNKAKDSGPIKSFREQGLKSGQEAKRAKDLDRANYDPSRDVDSSRLKKGWKRYQRTVGRSGVGTLGATGIYGRQARRSERNEAMKKSNESMLEDMRDQGISDYDEQLDYQQALAEDRKSVTVYQRDASGNIMTDSATGRKLTKEVSVNNAYGDTGQLAAAIAVQKQRKAPRNRQIAEALKAQGKAHILADAYEETAGDVKAVSADVVGKPLPKLKTEELVTQEASSVHELGYSAIDQERANIAAGNLDGIRSIARQIQIAKDSDIYDRATDEASRAAIDNLEATIRNIEANPGDAESLVKTAYNDKDLYGWKLDRGPDGKPLHPARKSSTQPSAGSYRIIGD